MYSIAYSFPLISWQHLFKTSSISRWNFCELNKKALCSILILVIPPTPNFVIDLSLSSCIFTSLDMSIYWSFSSYIYSISSAYPITRTLRWKAVNSHEEWNFSFPPKNSIPYFSLSLNRPFTALLQPLAHGIPSYFSSFHKWCWLTYALRRIKLGISSFPHWFYASPYSKHFILFKHSREVYHFMYL